MTERFTRDSGKLEQSAVDYTPGIFEPRAKHTDFSILWFFFRECLLLQIGGPPSGWDVVEQHARARGTHACNDGLHGVRTPPEP